VAIGVAILVYMEGSKKGWWGGGMIAVGVVILGYSLLNRWAVKNSRQYAAYYGATSAIGGLRGALMPDQIIPQPGNLSFVRW
jgi:hypothetical protein